MKSRVFTLSTLLLTALIVAMIAAAQWPPSTTITITPQLDVFQSASQTYTLSLTPQPGTAMMVFVNGL